MAGTPELLSGTFAGRYIIERELGRGATATVYLARDIQRGRSVAIKLLKAELAQSIGADRFLREIKVNEKLHHPHIVPVLDSGEHDGMLYFVLPQMEDGSLRQMLQREKQLPIEAAVTIARTIADALDYAHQQKLIHRDVKPENILFTSGQACLADFGIARAVERVIDESTTETGLVRGTPAYMSPEQASGSKHYDGRSDVYSLATVLYEMLAGVPAFIGPTPEAVIAQRFQHPPRELRVYRPSVPAALDAVIMKALAIAPADRYSTAAEFAQALEAAPRTQFVEERTSGPSVGITKPKKTALAGAILFGATIIALAFAQSSEFWTDPSANTDSARVAILPFRLTASSAGAPPHELLHAAFRRWQPLQVVPQSQIAEILDANGGDSVPSLRSARRVARRLGAGRFVIGRILVTPTGPALFAEYRDVAGNMIYSAQLDLPADSTRVSSTYDALADSLLLRGRVDGAGARASRGSHHLYAMQALIEGLSARDEWALERAESLLTKATELDPSLARGHLWLAQIRVWRGQPVLLSAAERAAAAPDQLNATERSLARALVAMGERRFSDACAAYLALVVADQRSFDGWYGLGECRRRDNVVVADRQSPSGWRFRSSYQEELDAYIRAFELLPTTYRAFQAGGYSRLRSLLFTSVRTVRRGVPADNSGKEFAARTRLVHDSITLVPFEMAIIGAGDPRASADPRAIARSRATFQAIAARWSSAFPRSPAAKEAVAISLELQSDRAALDTVLLAERLSSDPEQRLRFATFRVLLLVKFGLPDDTAALRVARRTADSLMRAHPSPDPKEAALLAPVAALSGLCSRTAELLRLAAQPAVVSGIRLPSDLVADGQVLLAHALLGCSRRAGAPSARDIARRIVADGGDDARLAAEYRLIGSAVAATFPLDSGSVVRLRAGGDYLLQAEADMLVGRAPAARESLQRVVAARRAQMPGEISPDAVLPESRLLLMLGDTATATASLASVLSNIRSSEPLAPYNPANNVARMSALVRGMALRADLGNSSDSLDAGRWARAVWILWGPTNSEQQAVLARMKQLAGL